MGKPFALDYAAVIAVAQARGVDVALLAEVLPAVERIIIAQLHEETDGVSGDAGDDDDHHQTGNQP